MSHVGMSEGFVQVKTLKTRRRSGEICTEQVGSKFAVNMIIPERGSWMGLKSMLDE